MGQGWPLLAFGLFVRVAMGLFGSLFSTLFRHSISIVELIAHLALTPLNASFFPYI